MSSADLLRWHNLLFLLPMGVAALLLALSALGIGSGDEGDSDTGEAGIDGSDLDGADAGDGGDAGGDSDTDAEAPTATSHGFGGLIGIGRAPLSIVASAFTLTWGFVGFWANQFLVRTPPEPGFAQILPSLLIAVVCGAVGARGAAEAAARLMPKHDSAAASRQSLVMLSGRVLFPVGENEGRVRIYDEHNTLHDNPARVAAGRAPIPKGRAIRVVDVDAQGRLIVEEEHSGATAIRS
jgi:hypothetical protein